MFRFPNYLPIILLAVWLRVDRWTTEARVPKSLQLMSTIGTLLSICPSQWYHRLAAQKISWQTHSPMIFIRLVRRSSKWKRKSPLKSRISKSVNMFVKAILCLKFNVFFSDQNCVVYKNMPLHLHWRCPNQIFWHLQCTQETTIWINSLTRRWEHFMIYYDLSIRARSPLWIYNFMACETWWAENKIKLDSKLKIKHEDRLAD